MKTRRAQLSPHAASVAGSGLLPKNPSQTSFAGGFPLGAPDCGRTSQGTGRRSSFEAPLRRRTDRCSRRSERAPALLQKRRSHLSSTHPPPSPARSGPNSGGGGEALTSEPIMKNSPSSSSWNLTGFCPKVLLNAIIIMAKEAAATPEPGRTRDAEKPRPKRRE